jgi:hypothetical protein
MSTISTTIQEVCRQFSQEGIRLELLSVDDIRRTVAVRIDLDEAECAECVMPRDHLERLIASSLERRDGRRFDVRLVDPRVAHEQPNVATVQPDGASRLVTVLDPTASGHGGDLDPGPNAGRLTGKKVLFRVDALWRSWDWTVDEWSNLLGSAGANVVSWKRWQGISGDKGQSLQAEYENLVQSADVVIAGLANCGSCSAWTIRDALTALGHGKSTAAVVTEHFAPLANILAENGYRPGLRIEVLPYPLDTLPESDVRHIARASFPSLLTTLGAEA